MIWVAKRLLFYGISILAGVYLLQKLHVTIEGKKAVLFFLAFSVVSGALQSINIWLLRKITDIDKLENIGYWAKERLNVRLTTRREAAFSRAATGLFFSILIGISSAYMKYLDTLAVPNWLLGASVMMVAISVILLFIALYEFHVVTKLESDLIQQVSKNEAKDKALSSIREEGEDRS